LFTKKREKDEKPLVAAVDNWYLLHQKKSSTVFDWDRELLLSEAMAKSVVARVQGGGGSQVYVS
jgi:hypothetical protein